MMMPGQPASNLVMIHSGCCFGILDGTFNKKTLPLHVGEPFRSGFCRGIGEAVFDGFRGVNLSPDHKVPLADGLFLVKPNPDSLREDINLQLTFGGVTGSYSLPGLFRLTSNPLFHHHPGALYLVHGRRSSFRGVSIRNIWRRIFKIKGLILVDIGNKLFALVIKGFEKKRFFAVATIKTDPGISYAYLTCPPRIDPQIMLDLRKKMRGRFMAKRGYQPEQIISKLREVEILLSTGHTVQAASRQIGVTEQTYYRWRKEYGGMKIDQAKRLKEVEKENTRLRKLVADLSLDNAILKEVSRGNF
jgi:putative transposase